jgi:hypothetical protein
MESNQRLASHAARLLGALAAPDPAVATGSTGNTALEVLASQVADALGVTRPAGDPTLSQQDNMPLRLLLEERRLLGTESKVDAIDAALRSGTLILAAHSVRGGGRGPARGVSMVLAPGGDAPLCAFTHEAALRAFNGATPVTAWVTESLRVWQFAVHVARRPVVIDPGSTAELHLDAARLQRLLG